MNLPGTELVRLLGKKCLAQPSGTEMFGLHDFVSVRESSARRERSVREIGGINNAIIRDLETLYLWLH
jgi:hypothetical protein